ncbi:MAG: M28 family metallopeptidase, partial [Acidobacteria bacterium]|nr:M28 family metallopeptidase [Acidobacteriota bacterium]
MNRFILVLLTGVLLGPAGAQQPVPRVQPLPLAVPGDPYEDITGEYMLARVGEIVEFSHQAQRDGLKLWGRIAGTVYAHRTAEYMEARFKELGLNDVRTERFPTGYPQWWPIDSEVRLAGGPVLTSAIPAHPTAKAKGGSPSTPEEGIEAEMVYVGLGRPADLVGKDLKGKIAVMRSLPRPSAYAHTAQAAAAVLKGRGHVGLIVIFDIPGNYSSAANFLCGYGDCEVPTFQVGAQDGAKIEAAITRGPAKIRLRLKTEVKTGLEGHNVMALLPGSSDEYIVLIAHTDSWFEGASDNASGLAALLAIARHFAAVPREKRSRNVLFVATEGHHAGSPGTAWLASRHKDVLAKAALVINCEHLATTLVVHTGNGLVRTNTETPRTLVVTRAAPGLLRIAMEAVNRYGITLAGEVSVDRYAGDVSPLRDAAVTTLSIMDVSLVGYHVSG